MEKLLVNKDEFLLLNKYKTHMTTAIQANWCASVPLNDIKELNKIWDNLSHQKHYVNPNCRGCVFEMIKHLAKYFLNSNKKNENSKN